MKKSDSRQKVAVSESSGSSGSVQFWVSRLPGAMGDLFLGIFSLATISYQSLWTHWTRWTLWTLWTTLWTHWTHCTLDTVDNIVDTHWTT